MALDFKNKEAQARLQKASDLLEFFLATKMTRLKKEHPLFTEKQLRKLAVESLYKNEKPS